MHQDTQDYNKCKHVATPFATIASYVASYVCFLTCMIGHTHLLYKLTTVLECYICMYSTSKNQVAPLLVSITPPRELKKCC